MAIPLKDFRLTVPESVLAALEAEAQAFGKDMQSIAREVLSDWAARKHRAYTVYARLVMANGMQTELPGIEAVDEGTTRNKRK